MIIVLSVILFYYYRDKDNKIIYLFLIRKIGLCHDPVPWNQNEIGWIQTSRQTQAKTSNDLFEIKESFRKLNVD